MPIPNNTYSFFAICSLRHSSEGHHAVIIAVWNLPLAG
jgi:hypothetical protein